MTAVDAVLGFALVAGLLTLVPGVDTALVVRSSLRRTRSYTVAIALGVATGVMVWGIAAAAGISALLTASETAHRVLTTAGAAYMFWLGASLIWNSVHGRRTPVTTAGVDPGAAVSPWRGWWLGLGSNLLNPKAGVFYIAMIPQFLPAGSSPVVMGVVLAGVHCLLFLAWCAVLIIGSGYARGWLNSPRSLALLDQVTGIVLIGFGGKLIIDSLPTTGLPAAMSPRLAVRISYTA